jgi:hypothetical protein
VRPAITDQRELIGELASFSPGSGWSSRSGQALIDAVASELRLGWMG